MEKTFRRFQTRQSARHAFAEAEAVTSLAHQIRVLRLQRGWSQKDLARMLGTTQAAVSRLEDPSYGRISFKTIVQLARVFDVAPMVRFVSTLQLLRERWAVRPEDLEVASFEEEAPHVVILPPHHASEFRTVRAQCHWQSHQVPGAQGALSLPAARTVTAFAWGSVRQIEPQTT
ncbi:MAG: helix-turn-helix transcriptional regulator [Rubrivivax sp.]|nr:helix-turn-helix transcriptional regulator [Rubrivivax sp.]